MMLPRFPEGLFTPEQEQWLRNAFRGVLSRVDGHEKRPVDANDVEIEITDSSYDMSGNALMTLQEYSEAIITSGPPTPVGS